MLKIRFSTLLLLCLIKISYAQNKYTTDWENLKQYKAVSEWFADAN